MEVLGAGLGQPQVVGSAAGFSIRSSCDGRGRLRVSVGSEWRLHFSVKPGIFIGNHVRIVDVQFVTSTPCGRCIRARFTAVPRFFTRRRILCEAGGGGGIPGSSCFQQVISRELLQHHEVVLPVEPNADVRAPTEWGWQGRFNYLGLSGMSVQSPFQQFVSQRQPLPRPSQMHRCD